MKKTLNKVFVLGNGESRKTLNLNVLTTKGKVYGCNAIYRDSVVDALSVVDGGMMHEVYSSGYALNNKCYFRSFEKLPEFAYEPLISGLSDNFKDWGDAYHIENEKGNRTQFVLNGTDPQQMQRLYEHLLEQGKDEEYLKMFLSKHHQWVTWTEDKDEVEIIPQEWSGWSAGPIAVRMALEKEKPDEVYLIGFDLDSVDGKINNVYKDTENYLSSDAPVTPSVNWIQQHSVNFRDFPNVKFYKVNTPELDYEIDEWSDFENVVYILQKHLDLLDVM